MDNDEWTEVLKNCYREATGYAAPVRFPAATYFQMGGDIDNATILLRKSVVAGDKAGMANDPSAFEVWALILRFWCGVGLVTITWERPANEYDGHYQRFLYRLASFSDIVRQSKWLNIIPVPDHDWVSAARALRRGEALGENALALNGPYPRQEVIPPADVEDVTQLSERELELILCSSNLFREFFQLTHCDRQLPVGLHLQPLDQLNNPPARNTAVFTGGKSAIDIVGINDRIKQIFVFEIKKGLAQGKVGALTELLFYTSVLRDTLGRSPLFLLVDRGNWNTIEFSQSQVISANKIESALVVPRLHSLLGARKKDGANLIAFLNFEISRTWNSKSGSPAVKFRAVSFTGPQSNIQFVDLA